MFGQLVSIIALIDGHIVSSERWKNKHLLYVCRWSLKHRFTGVTFIYGVVSQNSFGSLGKQEQPFPRLARSCNRTNLRVWSQRGKVMYTASSSNYKLLMHIFTQWSDYDNDAFHVKWLLWLGLCTYWWWGSALNICFRFGASVRL